MTVTSATSLLYLFRSKIEEAVGLVPGMGAEEKLKAVQFWNVVSEKLQEIVNNSAADINALALKLDEESSEKMTLDIENGSQTNIVAQNNVCASDFISTDTNYSVCGESDAHYQHTEVNTSHIGQFLSSDTTTSFSRGQHLDQEINCNNSAKQDDSLAYSSLSSLTTGDCVTKSNCPLEFSTKENKIGSSLVTSQTELNSNLSCTSNRRRVTARQKKSRFRTMKGRQNSSVPNKVNAAKKLKNELGIPSFSKTNILRKSLCKKGLKRMLNNENKNVFSYNSYIIECDKKNCSVINGDSNAFKADIMETKADLHSTIDCSLPICTDQKSPGKNKKNIRHGESADAHKTCTSEDEQNTRIETVYACEWCEQEFSDSTSLASHRWVHTKPFICTECDAQFSTKGNLLVHIRKHTGEKPFNCSMCSARFSTKGNLKRHVKTHSGEKPWECVQCGARFTEKKSLKVHMRRHTGEKPYQCQICGKKFSQTGILQTHMAMHLNEKAHLCEHCGKSFRQKSQLRLHMLRHEGVRKYICPTCPSRFLTKGDLERHTRIHTGERPFACEMCGKTFTRQQSLNEHKNRHYGVKPYECKYCGKSFAEMSACYKHIKQHEKSPPSEGDGQKSTSEENFPQAAESSPGLHISSTGSVGHVIIGSQNQFTTLPGQNFTVILHDSGEEIEVGNELTVENQDNLTAAIVTQNSGGNSNLDSDISDFTAINLLANASTQEQSY